MMDNLEKLERQVKAEPDNAKAKEELVNLQLRLKIKKLQDFATPIFNRVIWSKTPAFIQDICFRYIKSLLSAEDWTFIGSKIYSVDSWNSYRNIVENYSHNIGIFLHNKTGMKYSLIPGGFLAQKITDRFVSFVPRLVAQNLVTYENWLNADLNLEPILEPQKPGILNSRPVCNITFNAAENWCNQLGLQIPQHEVWEYFARAGSKGSYFWNYKDDLLHKLYRSPHYISLADDEEDGLYNSFGLYNIRSNVGEWIDSQPDPIDCWGDINDYKMGTDIDGFGTPPFVGRRRSYSSGFEARLIDMEGLGLRPVCSIRIPGSPALHLEDRNR